MRLTDSSAASGRLTLLRLLPLLLAVVLVGLLRQATPAALPGFEDRVGDAVWRLLADRQTEQRVVIVDIDEASLAKAGAWPWPRERLAELSDRLHAAGAALQVWDMVLPAGGAGDARLAQSLARNDVLVAQVLDLEPGRQLSGGALAGAVDGVACGAPLPEASGYLASAPELAAKAAGVGHITPRLGGDGAIRRMPGLICYHGQAYPPLGLSAVMAAAGASRDVRLEKGDGLLGPDWSLSLPALPGVRLPLDAAGDLRLPYWKHPDAWQAISAADVLAGKIPEGILKGAWVLVGGSAFGVHDAVPTPHGGGVAGVSVHAQFLASLLDDRLPVTPRGSWLLQAAAAALAALVLLGVAALARPRPWVLPLTAALLAGTMLGLHIALLAGRALWFEWSGPALFSLLAGGLMSLAAHLNLRREREALYANLSSYLPGPVAAVLAFQPPASGVRAERRAASVLMADLRNFSAYCEARPPEEAAAVLHAFLNSATEVAEAGGGRVETFYADSVLIIWEGQDSAARAVAGAEALVQAAEAWLPDLASHGLEPLAIGVGLEMGEILIGSFGPARRRSHTAMGEAVTVATRLQGLTADLADPILVGPAMAAELPANSLECRGRFLLEGLVQPRQVYAPAVNRGGQSCVAM